MLKRTTWSVLFIAGILTKADAAPPPAQERHQLHMKAENAQCLMQKRPAFVKAWAVTIPGTEAERKLLRPADSYFTSCFASWPNAYASAWNYEAIRQRLLIELLRPRFAELVAQPPAGLSHAAWYPPDQARDVGAVPALLANDLGFCLARANWSDTRTLILAEEGSSDEKGAMRGLVTLLAGCIPPGQRLTLDTARLRSIMVETVYHAISS